MEGASSKKHKGGSRDSHDEHRLSAPSTEEADNAGSPEDASMQSPPQQTQSETVHGLPIVNLPRDVPHLDVPGNVPLLAPPHTVAVMDLPPDDQVVDPQPNEAVLDLLSHDPVLDLPTNVPLLDLPPNLPQSETASGGPVTYQAQTDTYDQATTHSHNEPSQGASTTASSCLWDRHNPAQQGLVYQSEQYKNLLRHKLTDLTRSVDVKAMMPVLRQLHVIDAYRQEKIEFQATRADMVMRTVDHVERGPLWHLHGFLRGLAVTNQESLIAVLGLDPSIYEDAFLSSDSSHSTHQKQHFYRQAGSGEMREIPMAYFPGILQHCEHSERSLMKVTLFGFDDNTPLDLTPIYINQDPECKKNQRDFVSTSAEELFLKLHQSHSPNSLLLEGDAGTGKSTFLRQYAHTCCKELLECHKKGPESPCEGHTWALVVYIAAGSITGSQEAAIRQNLQCHKNHEDQIMTMIGEYGDGVLIINDAIDKLRKLPERESLRKYTALHQHDGSPKVLVSCRVGLCPIQGKFFDRHLVMKGFSLDQGMTYMNRYLEVNHSLTEHPALDHISSCRQNFDWVLTNPLRVHILSELIARGVITLEHVKLLNTAKLLKILEQFLVRRDITSRGTNADVGQSKEFYQMCLDCLLNDKVIRDADIPSSSPFMAFLSKHTEFNLYAEEDVSYTFSHAMFQEYMAVQGLIECLKDDTFNKRALLLLMSSDQNMRNTLQLACGYISEFEPKLDRELIFIIQASLILQTETVVCEANEVTDQLLKLPALIQETVSYEDIFKSLTSQQTTTIDESFNMIQEAFNTNARSLQQAGWFCNSFTNHRCVAVSDTLDFITDGIQQCHPALRQEVYRQTVHKLLPCTRYNLVDHEEDGTEQNYDQFVFPTSSGRWAVVKKHITTSGETYTVVSAWCPADIVQTLTELYRHQAPPTGAHGVQIDLDIPASLWGVQPDEVLTHEQWLPVLHQLLQHRVTGSSILTDTVSGTTPLCGLLTALQGTVTPTQRMTGGISVWYGQVSEEQLQKFNDRPCTVNLEVQLGYTKVLLTTEQDQDYVNQLHQRVQDIMYSEYPPTYITPGGRTFEITKEDKIDVDNGDNEAPPKCHIV